LLLIIVVKNVKFQLSLIVFIDGKMKKEKIYKYLLSKNIMF